MNLDQYLAQNPKKYLIFDFDQTILTLHLPWQIFINEIYRRLESIDKEFINQHKNIDCTINMNSMIEMYGQKAKDIIYPYREQFEKDYLKGITVNQQLIEFIKSSSSKYELYIWSSNMRSTILRQLDEQDLTNYFKKVISQDSVDLIKPAPDGFYKIFDQTTQNRSDFLMIGDSSYDKLASEKAGIDFLHVNNI